MPDPDPPPTPDAPPPTRRGRRVDLDRVLGTLAPAQELAKSVTNGVGMRFVLIPAGTFLMGAPEGEPGFRANEGPVHEVLIDRPFYLAVHPVTQAAYQAVAGRNPAKFTAAAGGGPDHPVENVSWDEAAAFCRRLGEFPAERRASRTYRLPTEAEWEYACRAGGREAFAQGHTFAPSQGNFDAKHPYGAAAPGPPVGKTTPVGAYPENVHGLFDMHGNVWEWCADWYAEAYYKGSPLHDPGGPPAGRFRVLRGGSWRNGGERCRAAYRNALEPHQRDSATGFRVVLVV